MGHVAELEYERRVEASARPASPERRSAAGIVDAVVTAGVVMATRPLLASGLPEAFAAWAVVALVWSWEAWGAGVGRALFGLDVRCHVALRPLRVLLLRPVLAVLIWECVGHAIDPSWGGYSTLVYFTVFCTVLPFLVIDRVVLGATERRIGDLVCGASLWTRVPVADGPDQISENSR